MIQSGDVVRLKSGSPDMTVGNINWLNRARVYYWRDIEDTARNWPEKNFYELVHVDALEKVEVK